MTKSFIFLFLRSFVLLHNSLFWFVYCYLFSLYLATLYKHVIIFKIKQKHSLSILTHQKTEHFTKISKYKKRTKVATQEKNKRAGCRFSLIFIFFLAFRADLPAQLVYFYFTLVINFITQTKLKTLGRLETTKTIRFDLWNF